MFPTPFTLVPCQCLINLTLTLDMHPTLRDSLQHHSLVIRGIHHIINNLDIMGTPSNHHRVNNLQVTTHHKVDPNGDRLELYLTIPFN